MKLSYPIHILPQRGYHKIKSSDLSSNTYFIRQIRRGHQIKNVRNLRAKCAKLLSASEFYGGISCSLLSVFKKSDSAYIPSNDEELGYTDYWDVGQESKLPDTKNYEYLPWQGFFGFKMKDIYEFKSDIPIKNHNGKEIRRDTAILRFVHAPTFCNFWHYNMFLHAVNSKTKKIYNLSDKDSGVSKTQVCKIADSLIDDIAPLLRTGKNLKYTYIAKSKYK